VGQDGILQPIGNRRSDALGRRVANPPQDAISPPHSVGDATLCRAPACVCQGNVEMSCLWQSRNVAFPLGLSGVRVILRVPVKRKRAKLASNPIEE